jgi:hypothetical protein
VGVTSPVGAALLLLGLLCPLPATAQQTASTSGGWELGARYWLSTGTTSRSHNAQPLVPQLGNPTSILTYDNLDAQAVELHGRKALGNAWFFKAMLGVGRINTGMFEDEDFFAGQRRFSDTLSSVKGKGLRYVSLDVGRDLWSSSPGAYGPDRAWGLFAGYQEWTERANAYGLSNRINLVGNPELGNTVPAVSNEVSWRSVRVGLAARTALGGRSRLLAEAAFIPYSSVRDEDSHHLRTSPNDLGPTPNIMMEGRGAGLQLDLEWRQALSDGYEFGLGFRYWQLGATRGNRRAAGTSLPLVELESQRSGVTASVTKSW